MRITGITDHDLIGRRIDDRVANDIISSADIVIAHNAAFDRPMVEKRLTALPIKQWACSCVEIDWAAAGFEGRSLGWLCAQAGWFYDAHRARGMSMRSSSFCAMSGPMDVRCSMSLMAALRATAS